VKFAQIIVVATCCVALATPALASLNILACEPEWAALAGEIGGDQVNVFSATHAKEDPHRVRARPSLIAKARHADLLVCSGAGLEVGWLPILLRRASSQVQAGAPGHLMASAVVPLLGHGTTVVDRRMGDLHPEGNPHVQLDPRNILKVGKVLADRLASIDTANAEYYEERFAAFANRWERAMIGWEAVSSSLRGTAVVVNHQSFDYLVNWLGMKVVASLEPRPGIPPTTSHLETVLEKLKKQPAQMILRAPYEPDGISEWVSAKTRIPVMVLPYTVGGDEHTSNLFDLFDRTLAMLSGVVRDEP
jgi:zinc/manganese transport system substrate-binding protein